MDIRDIGFRRLSNQHVAGGKFQKVEDVVRWMGALQAQDYHQAVWAIGTRTVSGTLADVEQALEDGTIIRTWPMRGTIHFVPPEDARWMLDLCASRRLAASPRRMAQLELDADILARSRDLFCEALNGGRRLTRPDMMSILENAGISTRGQRGYHILWHVAQTGVIYMGPMQDKQQTFALLDDLVPEARDLSRDEALAELARRYFASHGPATVHDLAWWAGITVADARQGLEAVKSGLVSDSVEGTPYWMKDGVAAGHDDPATYLLPGFDEFLLGYKDRSAVLAAEHAQQIVPGNNGMFLAMMVTAGQVVGTWKRTVKKKQVDVSLRPFVPLDHLDERVAQAARAYADFVGLPLSVEIVSADD